MGGIDRPGGQCTSRPFTCPQFFRLLVVFLYFAAKHFSYMAVPFFNNNKIFCDQVNTTKKTLGETKGRNRTAALFLFFFYYYYYYAYNYTK